MIRPDVKVPTTYTNIIPLMSFEVGVLQRDERNKQKRERKKGREKEREKKSLFSLRLAVSSCPAYRAGPVNKLFALKTNEREKTLL